MVPFRIVQRPATENRNRYSRLTVICAKDGTELSGDAGELMQQECNI